MPFGPLIDVAGLRARIGDASLRVVDCRWELGRPQAGRAAYLAGHIPGAAFLDLDRDLSGEPGESGRHPLPAPADFEAAARSAGICSGTHVVAYDEAGEGGAVRLWWLLHHYGHDDVAVLDGGLSAWRAARGALVPGEEDTEPGDFTARPREDDMATADEIADNQPALVDARAPERYAGLVEPIDPVAGHIPGSVNLPFTDVAPGGRFLPRAELRDRIERATGGHEDLVAYCGSGVTACTLVLAAELAGVRARLYPGSWSEWCARGLPAER